jgi:hypothetical protein
MKDQTVLVRKAPSMVACRGLHSDVLLASFMLSPLIIILDHWFTSSEQSASAGVSLVGARVV